MAQGDGHSAKTRHVDSRLFWIQEKVQGKVLTFLPVSGHINPSDVGTKVLSEKRFIAMLGAQNFVDTVNSDSEIGLDEWSELCAEVGMHVQLRRLNARMKFVRGATAARRSQMMMMIGCLLAATSGHGELEVKGFSFELEGAPVCAHARISVPATSSTSCAGARDFFDFLFAWMMPKPGCFSS
eukprot:s1895_g2.t1